VRGQPGTSKEEEVVGRKNARRALLREIVVNKSKLKKEKRVVRRESSKRSNIIQ
jgi:hypothetical protein